MATRKKLDRLGVILISGSAAVVIALLGVRFLIGGESIDKTDLCPIDRPYPHTVLLVDKTDPFTPSQQRFLRNLTNKVKFDLERYEKLSIYVLDNENYLAPAPVFAMCNPGTGAGANELYQNPQRVQQRFDEFFGDPLDAVLEKLLEAAEAPHSPIMEMLREVSFVDDFNTETPERRLIVVSDMLQNMPAYSHYQDSIDYDGFAASAYADEVAALLGGVTVTVVYLWRPGTRNLQGLGHIRFWDRYFAEFGARLVEVERVR